MACLDPVGSDHIATGCRAVASARLSYHRADLLFTWETVGWPTTAGVWLYHDHSIMDMDDC